MAVGFVWPMTEIDEKYKLYMEFDFFDSSLIESDSIKKLMNKFNSILDLNNLGADFNLIIKSKKNKNILLFYFLFLRIKNFLNWIYENHEELINLMGANELEKIKELSNKFEFFLNKYNFICDKVKKSNKLIFQDQVLDKIIEVNNFNSFYEIFRSKKIDQEYAEMINYLNNIKYFRLSSIDNCINSKDLKNSIGDNCLFDMLFIDELCYQNSLNEEQFRKFEEIQNKNFREFLDNDTLDFKIKFNDLNIPAIGYKYYLIWDFLKNSAIENNKNLTSRPKEFYDYNKTVKTKINNKNTFKELLDDICSAIERRNYKIHCKGFINSTSDHVYSEGKNNNLIKFSYNYKKIHLDDDIDKCSKLNQFTEDVSKNIKPVKNCSVLFDYLILAENENGVVCPVDLRLFVTSNYRPNRRKFYLDDEYNQWIQFGGFVPLYKFDNLFDEIEEYLKSRTLFHFLVLKNLLKNSFLFFNSNSAGVYNNHLLYERQSPIEGIFCNNRWDPGSKNIFNFFIENLKEKLSLKKSENDLNNKNEAYSLFFEKTIGCDQLKDIAEKISFGADIFHFNLLEWAKLKIVSFENTNKEDKKTQEYLSDRYLSPFTDIYLRVYKNYNSVLYSNYTIISKTNAIFMTPPVPINQDNQTLVDYIVNWFELQFLKNHKMYENYKFNSKKILKQFFELVDFIYKYRKNSLDEIINFIAKNKNSDNNDNTVLGYLKDIDQNCIFLRSAGPESFAYPAIAAYYLIVPPKFSFRDIYIDSL
jgi:ASC-1-like (ASCH) protein